MKKIQNYKKCQLKTGDKVLIIAGKNKGQMAKIKEIDRNTGKVLLSGENLCTLTCFKKKTAEIPGGISTRVKPVHISNLKEIV